MKHFSLFIIFILFFKGAFAKDHVVYLGDKKIIVRHLQHGTGKTFIHLHENEKTALKAAKHIVNTDGGSLITLVHGGSRNIRFKLNHRQFEFDPNRIFSDQGIHQTLSRFGPYSKKAHQEVKKLADRILTLLPPGKIIAVHNNKEYSVQDYLPGHELAKEASDIYIRKKQSIRNFFVTTQADDFTRLKQLPFNGILQSKKASNDGSLSVCLAHRHYINVEAGYGQLTAQIKMLRLA